MLDKILDKLGIYDLLAVLLTGTIISVTTMLYVQFFVELNFIGELSFKKFGDNYWLIFLLISYFVGLIFQEFGSSIEKIFTYRENKLLLGSIDKEPLKKSLKLFKWEIKEKDDNVYLTGSEWNEIVSFVCTALKLNRNNPDINIIYNYCRYHATTDSGFSRFEKDQSMSAMARSLYLYFLLCYIIFIFGFMLKGSMLNIWDWNYLYSALLNLSLTLILNLRGIRFAKMRYAKILRLFYYQYIAGKPDKVNNNQSTSNQQNANGTNTTQTTPNSQNP